VDQVDAHGARRAIARRGAGLHLKTAGTNWLEELIGLAEASPEGLAMAKTIYHQALEHVDALCAPYAAVIDIHRAQLPSAETVAYWTSGQFTGALRHDPKCPQFNPNLRQLFHVGYKVAAQIGRPYLELVAASRKQISQNVTDNLYTRHIEPLFIRNAAA